MNTRSRACSDTMVVKQDKVAFEDALRMTGFGKFNWLSLVLCSEIIMAMAFEIFSVSYLVPGSSCELATTSSQQGLMAAVPLIGILLTSHVMGYLADTRGRRLILMYSMALAFVSGALAALSPNWIVLSCLKFCSSAAVSGAYALSLTLLGESTPSEKRSFLVMLTTSVFLIALGLMAVISMPILPLKFSFYVPILDIHFNSWRLLDLIYTLPSLIGAITMACWFESPKYLLGAGRHDEALGVLKSIFAVNSGKDPELYGVNSVVLDEESQADSKGFWSSIKTQVRPLMRPPLLYDALLLAALIFICYISINPFTVWLPFILSAAMPMGDHSNAGLTICEMIRQSRNTTALEQPTDCSMNQLGLLLVFSVNAVIAIISLVISSITHFIGRRSSYITLQLVGGVMAIVINFSRSWTLSAICMMVFLSGIINFGTLSSYCVDLFPTYVKAMAVCMSMVVGRGGAMLGINFLKYILDKNCEAAFYIFGSLTIVGGFIGWLLPSENNLVERKEQLKLKLAAKT